MAARIEIDLRTCVGFAECVKTAPHVFHLDAFANQSAASDQAGADLEAARRGAAACPVSAISVEDEREGPPGGQR